MDLLGLYSRKLVVFFFIAVAMMVVTGWIERVTRWSGADDAAGALKLTSVPESVSMSLPGFAGLGLLGIRWRNQRRAMSAGLMLLLSPSLARREGSGAGKLELSEHLHRIQPSTSGEIRCATSAANQAAKAPAMTSRV